ncbi:DUF2835 domain-containing protein [Geothrix sp. PMB-07]|uniref:DUF2835 domain-containing protein n=1 Tax=Geothrix sp. PMB-07 TaxID=3068640 RepID=UPI0027408677|nr:DUF2835 domain-containing protein [Geothrix sp. PMB-07]WLT32315.1 DUF2835 domain-containing protein [Geothrix sp. PMB-07]
MKQFHFRLDISAERYLATYRGEVREVVARCMDGQVVQFPASLLQPFVTASGIHGAFVLTCNDQNRAPRLEQLSVG